MRLVQVAKALGMTGQELRKELLTVNFGVKPTDREIPDGLAKGIVRFIAQKHGLTVDVESIGLESVHDDEEEQDGGESTPQESSSGMTATQSPVEQAAPVPGKSSVRPESLNV